MLQKPHYIFDKMGKEKLNLELKIMVGDADMLLINSWKAMVMTNMSAESYIE